MRALVPVLVLLAGCVTPGPAPDAQAPTVSAPSGFWLDADMGLVSAEVAEARVPLAWGYAQWLEGIVAPAWTSAPAEQAFVVTNATAHVTYEALSAVTTLGSRPELTMWWGVEDSIVEHGFAPGPPALAPGQRVSAPFEIGLPLGGLVVESGQRLVLRVGSYYADDKGRSAMAAIVGGPEGTRVEMRTSPVVLPATSGTEVLLEEEIELRGGRCMRLPSPTGADMAWRELTLPAGALGLDVVVERAQGTGPPDVDFVLVDAEGESVAHALGSAGQEAIRLRAPNLAAMAPGAMQLGVYACTAQSGTARVLATALT